MARACLDSWAVLAWLQDEEPAATMVDERIASAPPIMSWINLIEVYYRIAREHGADQAQEILADLRDTVSAELPGVARMQEVGSLKAEHPIALADCFAIATAAAAGAALLTGDPEIIDRSDNLPCDVIDARPGRR